MPWSWVKVPTGTSPALSTCVAEHEAARTRKAYEDCIRQIIERDGGDLGPDDVKFEANGTWAHVHFRWADYSEKLKIMRSLHATYGIDLLTATEFDALEQQEPESTS